MPLSLTFTEGVLPVGTEHQAISQLTEAMFKWHGLTGNRVIKPNITASVHRLPKSSTFSGGELFSGAWIEWKVPSIAFNSREIQQGFFKDATEIIHTLSGGKQPRDSIYVNIVHTVGNAWNLNGEAVR